MSLAQITFELWTAASPVIYVAASIIGGLLAVSMVVLRGQALSSFVRRVVLRRPKYDYRRIFQEYIERFNSMEDRRELYTAILSAACRIVSASGASLIIKDTNNNLQMKATFGLKPFSFDVGEVRDFLSWIESRRQIVTRRDVMASGTLREVKGEALRWFVQFNAEACVPLFVGDKLYGIINLGGRKNGRYDPETRDLLKLLGVQFATAIHNANLYQALVKQNQDLQDAARFKNQILSNMSHEIRTPLTSIIGLSELMAEGGDGPVSDDQIKHLSLVRLAGKRLLDTMTSMLDLSKLEANRLGLKVQKVNVNRIVSQVASDVHPNDSTSLEIKLGEDTPGVYGDEDRLKQILKHLLDNAAKFTKKGKISVEAEKCGEMLKICVKDTGIGIEKEKQKSIFDGFRQCDGGITREYEGLGLGLAISKKLVELHGGRLWLSSKIGRGSEFNFTLPLKPAGVYTNTSHHPRRFNS